jgi:hypothetical protein
MAMDASVAEPVQIIVESVFEDPERAAEEFRARVLDAASGA